MIMQISPDYDSRLIDILRSVSQHAFGSMSFSFHYSFKALIQFILRTFCSLLSLLNYSQSFRKIIETFQAVDHVCQRHVF